MKKKVIASMLALSMIAGTSSAVFAAENTTAEMADASDVDGTTISFWHSMGGVNGEALDTLVKQFNEENEYGITVDAQYQGEYDDSLNKLKSAQIGNMGADLVQVYEIGTRFMIDSGWIVPMQEMIDGDGYDLSQIEPNLAAYYTIDNELYSMPFNSSTPILYYNKDMFEKAGITETPQTLEDLLDVCKKLKDAGMTPISAGNYDMIMRYPAFKAFRLEGNDFIDNARMGKEKFNSETGIATAQYTQDIAQYFSEGWTSSDTTAQMDLFLNSGAAMLYTGTWDTPDLTDDEGNLKDDISMFKLPVDSEGTATGENDYYANCGIGTAILKDSMSDEMKDFISYVGDNFADTAMYEFNMLPSMMPSDSEKLPELTQQILSDLENCGTFAQCWDVRLDPSTNEVYRKELASLGMGESTPEEFCENMDKAVEQYASDYFDTEE